MSSDKHDIEGIMASAIIDLAHVALAHAPKCSTMGCDEVALWERTSGQKMCDRHCEAHLRITPGDKNVLPVLEAERLRKLAGLIKLYAMVSNEKPDERPVEEVTEKKPTELN